MGILRNSERETHISMCRDSNVMQIYTSEHHIMNKLDKYVHESDDWKVVDTATCNGEIVSKIYEAQRDFLILKKKKRVMSEEQKTAARERLCGYWKNKKNSQKKQ